MEIAEKVGDYFFVAGIMYALEFLSVILLKFMGGVSQDFLAMYGFFVMMFVYFVGGVLYSRRFEKITVMDVGIILLARLFRKISVVDISLIFILARVVIVFVLGAKVGYMFEWDKKED